MTPVLLVGASVVAFLFARRRLRMWKITRTARMQSEARDRATNPTLRERLARAWRWATPRLFPRAWRWRPGRRPERGALLARPGLTARWIRVKLGQHLLITGATGSGKSCALIALTASARAAGKVLEFWDAKDGLEGQPYAAAGIPVVELNDQPARLVWLLDDELPRRAAVLKARGARTWDETKDGPELVLILDELGVSMTVLPTGTVATLIKKCRAYGVWLWAGEQLGKASTVDTDIRSQFAARICLSLGRASDARVALGEESVADGWMPHHLPARWLLVKDADHKKPRPARCATVADELLLRYPMPSPPVSLVKAPAPAASRPSAHINAAQAPTRTAGRSADALTDRQAQALAALDVAGCPMGPAAVGKELGIPRNRAADVLDQLRRRGLLEQTPDGFTIPLNRAAERD
ncbi:hypothetical protein [Streptomyces sp. NPDC005385]|uniref:hypothetical protein n=1 Tax=Streptomyces sp. NPDC005385 TaxID=3157039 RepID=UPI00339F4921